MGKDAPAAPAAPDPTATASAQATANVGTAVANSYLNNPDQVTPYGTHTTAATGTQSVTNPDGSVTNFPTFTTTDALSAAGQHQLDQQNYLKSSLNKDAITAAQNLGTTISNPLTADQFGTIQTSAGATPTLQNSYGSGGAIQSGYDQGGAIQTGYNTGPALQYGYNPGGTIQSDVNLGMANTNAPTTFGATQNNVQYFAPQDTTAARDQAQNAVLQRLAPSMAAQQESLSANLANQGTAQGSAAYNAAQLSQAQANNDLRLGAVATGDAEQQALFGESATANQLYNSAQNQDYSQQLGRGTFAQTGIAQNNAAVGQNNTAVLDMGQFHNAAQGQQNSQNAAAAGFFNQTVGQENQQNAALAAFGNAAQGQQNSENAAAAGFNNLAQAQQYGQNAQSANFFNQASQQDYQDRLSGAAFNNQAVTQQLQQASALQNQQINQISALMSGGQVQAPSFTPYQGSTIDQTPLSSDVYASANLAQQAYNSQLQNQAANTSAFGSALGGLFSAGKKSDRRLKSDVSPVIRARNGLMIYRYRLATEAPGWHIGFMADEVALIHPEAVWTDPDDGWARVDYEKAVA